MRRVSTYRFLINTNPAHLEVHDLDNEKTGPNECQIDEIIRSGHAKYLNFTSKSELNSWLINSGYKQGYDGCEYCLNEFHRK